MRTSHVLHGFWRAELVGPLRGERAGSQGVDLSTLRWPMSTTAHSNDASADKATREMGAGPVTTVRGIVQQIVIPQGFTLSITGTIAIMNGHRCQAGAMAIWLFILGAGAGYSTVALASSAHRRSSAARPQPITGLPVLNVVPVIVVPVAVAAAWWIPDPRVAFAAAGFVAAAGYVSAFALFLHLFIRRSGLRADRVRQGARIPRAGHRSKT
jgi:hypothetical protein